jgi:hypothetical protein
MSINMGMGLGVNAGQQIAGYTAEAQAYFAAMTTQPDAASATIYNNTIGQLVANGLWTLIEKMWFLANHDTSANTGLEARRNVITPSEVMTRNNAPTYTQYRGFTGSIGLNYLITGFNPGDGGSHLFKQDDAGFGVAIDTNVTGASIYTDDIGQWVTLGYSGLNSKNSEGNFVGRINSSALVVSVANATSVGFRALWRNGTGANKDAYQINGTVTNGTGQASLAPGNSLWHLCYCNGGALSTRRINFAFASKYMTPTQAALFYSIINTYYLTPMLAR